MLPTWLVSRIAETDDENRIYWLLDILRDLHNEVRGEHEKVAAQMRAGAAIHYSTVNRIAEMEEMMRELRLKTELALVEKEHRRLKVVG
jgi:hypothetical protein